MPTARTRDSAFERRAPEEVTACCWYLLRRS